MGPSSLHSFTPPCAAASASGHLQCHIAATCYNTVLRCARCMNQGLALSLDCLPTALRAVTQMQLHGKQAPLGMQAWAL